MILYFTGTGNSRYAAKRIAEKTGDEVVDLFDKIKNRDYGVISSENPWIVVSPTYAWRIPRILEKWIKKADFKGSKDIYFVMTCGDSIGNAGKYLKKLCAQKNMNYSGCYPIVMPENYIAMFTTPAEEEALNIIEKSVSKIDKAAETIKRREVFTERKIKLSDRLSSGIVNRLFYTFFVHAKKFYAEDKCIACGKCEKVCPLDNIKLINRAPVWGNNCTHCMACISCCPEEAIEYGRHSKGLPRYTCPEYPEK